MHTITLATDYDGTTARSGVGRAHPGAPPGGATRMTIMRHDVVGPDGHPAPCGTFTLQRPRRDGS